MAKRIILRKAATPTVPTVPADDDSTKSEVAPPAPKKIILLKKKSTPEVEEIRIDQTPTQEKWNYKPLYRTTLSDGLMFWQIGCDGTKLVTTYGHNGGKMQTVETEIEIKSGKTLQGQALINARRKCLDKIKEGYVQSGSTDHPEVKGMKGTDYNPKSIKYWPNYVSKKLDGIRLLVYRDPGNGTDGASGDGGRLVMKTYLNSVYTHMKHIEKELLPYFDYLPAGAILDGELYNNDITFNSLTSIVKSVKNIHPDIEMIEYWIFDINYIDPEGTPYEKRYQTLIDSFQAYQTDLREAKKPKPKKFHILEAELVYGHDDDDLIDRYGQLENEDGEKYATVTDKHNDYVSEGFEGIMIKRASIGIPKSDTSAFDRTLYIAGKRNHIMKWKYVNDMEVEVIGVEDCVGKEKGAAKLLVKDENDNEFPVRYGTIAERQEWLADPDLVIGKILTIKYQELSDYGVPRFAVGKAWRNYE